MTANNNDNLLLAQIRKDDRAAFDQLFQKYYVRLCCFAERITQSEALTQEVVQQVFINIWEKRNKLYIETTLIAYLVTATKNNALSLLKKNKIRKGYESTYATDYTTAYEQAGNNINHKALVKKVNEGILELPAKCREIYQLSRKEGLSYDEIAGHLGVSSKTVENQMGIAMKKLRLFVKEYQKEIY